MATTNARICVRTLIQRWEMEAGKESADRELERWRNNDWDAVSIETAVLPLAATGGIITLRHVVLERLESGDPEAARPTMRIERPAVQAIVEGGPLMDEDTGLIPVLADVPAGEAMPGARRVAVSGVMEAWETSSLDDFIAVRDSNRKPVETVGYTEAMRSGKYSLSEMRQIAARESSAAGVEAFWARQRNRAGVQWEGLMMRLAHPTTPITIIQ